MITDEMPWIDAKQSDFFRRNADLREEFNELYPALFKKADRYLLPEVRRE